MSQHKGSQLANALDALRRGFKVFPCSPRTKEPEGGLVPHGSKDATTDEAQVRRWWTQNPTCNVGILGGTIVDIDTGPETFDDVRRFMEKHKLPATLVIRTGRRPGYGAQIHYAGQAKKSGPYEVDGFKGEIRSGNLYGIWTGSIHPSGNAYEIVIDHPRSQWPDGALTAARKKAEKPHLDAATGDRKKIPIGQRYNALISEIGKLWQRGSYSRELTIEMGIKWAHENYDLGGEEFDEDRVRRRIIHLIDSYVPGTGTQEDEDVAQDVALIDEFIKDLNATPDKKSVIGAASRLNVIDFADRRKPLAGRLGWGVVQLDAAIREERSANVDGDEPVLLNAVNMLRDSEEFQGVLAFNEFSLYTVAQKKTPWEKEAGTNWTDHDDSQLACWFQNRGLLVRTPTAAEAAQLVAHSRPYHPVKQYFESLTWDGVDRLEHMLIDHAEAEDTPYVRAATKCWIISAVARIYRPGCQADYTLVLEGPQGKKKSSLFYTLAYPWFSDHISDLSSKDARLELHGVLIMELAELSAIKRADSIERVKSFLTARADMFRAPYDRRVQNFPRTNIFCGTTNDATPFSDATGNRRFWPIRVGAINIKALEDAKDQLWAEAKHLYDNDERWWFESDALNAAAAVEQEKRYESGVYDSSILEWLQNPKRRTRKQWKPETKNSNEGPYEDVPLEGDPQFLSTHDRVLIRDILIHALNKDLERHDDRDRKLVAKCLTHEGWKQDSKKINGVTHRVYYRPESQQQEE